MMIDSFLSFSYFSFSWIWLMILIVILVALWKPYLALLSQHAAKKTEISSEHHPRRPFQRKMSSLGRFTLQSETPENPSIMTFFLLLTHKNGRDVELEEFNDLLQRRMLDKYERFNARVSPQNGAFFEVRKYRVYTKYV